MFVTFLKRTATRCYSTTPKKQCIEQKPKPTKAPEIPSFMPVINIPESELAHNAFYSLHRPLLGLSIPEPFLVGDIVGQIDNTTSNWFEFVECYLLTHICR